DSGLPRIRLATRLHESRRAALADCEDVPRLGVPQHDGADVDPPTIVVDHAWNRAEPSWARATWIRSRISESRPTLSSSEIGHHLARVFSPSAGCGSPPVQRHRTT